MGDALRSAGQPLDPGTRDFMEERFGRDFGSVRVHTGPAAEAAAGSIQARAFTVGSDVVFGGATSDPGHGGELLAHELTHVAQQGHAGSSRLHGRRAADLPRHGRRRHTPPS